MRLVHAPSGLEILVVSTIMCACNGSSGAGGPEDASAGNDSAGAPETGTDTGRGVESGAQDSGSGDSSIEDATVPDGSSAPDSAADAGADAPETDSGIGPDGSTCEGGSCGVPCNAVTCPTGCCDAQNTCQVAPSCGTNGASCAAGCPVTVTEASSLALWLVADDFDPSKSLTWIDRSPNHANAKCVAGLYCPTLDVGAIASHNAAKFDGTNPMSPKFVALTDPGTNYGSGTWSIFVVASPSSTVFTDQPFVDLSDSTLADRVQFFYTSCTKNGLTSIPCAAIEVKASGVTPNPLFTSGWTTPWVLFTGQVDSAGNGFATYEDADGGSPFAGPTFGAVGVAAGVEYNNSVVGAYTDGSAYLTGDIAEIVVFRTYLSASSASAVQAYLVRRYGF